MKNNSLLLTVVLSVILFLSSCSGSDTDNRLNFRNRGREVPAFEADTAFKFVQEQLDFGPRNPGSESHRLAKSYLIGNLVEYAGERNVFAQHFTHKGYEDDTLQLTNMIAAFNPSASDRIMLCAHWDTRPRAEEDRENPNKPIPGADDGASGVAVLLELTRIFENNPPPIGVDIILFDGEDYGKKNDMSNYFLGSRYWANNPPVKNYSPRFGILLDMVGGEGAQFPKERNSYRIAPALVNEIWSIAEEKGYSDIFIDREGSAISDDHMVINRILNIPTIDIIRHDPPQKNGEGSVRFPSYWHTQRDSLHIIDPKTLDAVGSVLVELIYNRI